MEIRNTRNGEISKQKTDMVLLSSYVFELSKEKLMLKINNLHWRLKTLIIQLITVFS